MAKIFENCFMFSKKGRTFAALFRNLVTKRKIIFKQNAYYTAVSKKR